MPRERRPSPQAIGVLRALAAEPSAWRYGYDLSLETGLKSGSLYPILMRLADRGLLEAAWEPDAPPGRPPRHLYRLTDEGSAFATTVEPATPTRSRRQRVQLRGAS